MRELGSGAGLSVFAFGYFFLAIGLPAGQGEPGPRFFPLLLSGILFVLAGFIALRGWRERHRIGGELARPAVLMGLTVVYAVSFSRLGFLLSTLAYTAGVVWVLGERRWRVVAIPVATTLFLYLAFVVGLGVVLP